jgi:hypothetical protein
VLIPAWGFYLHDLSKLNSPPPTSPPSDTIQNVNFEWDTTQYVARANVEKRTYLSTETFVDIRKLRWRQKEPKRELYMD